MVAQVDEFAAVAVGVAASAEVVALASGFLPDYHRYHLTSA